MKILKKNKNNYINIYVAIIIFIFFYLSYGYVSKKKKKIKQYEKVISQKQQLISEQEQNFDMFLLNLELEVKEAGVDIQTSRSNLKLANSTILEKNKLIAGFYAGIHYTKFPGSAFIDFYNNKLFIVSARGILAFSENLNDKILFKQIKNNINDYIDLKQFKKDRGISLKDMLIHKEKIFISYTEEIKEDCWNISVIYGDINYENINFKKIFSAPSKECVHSTDNIDKQFNPLSSGGRIISFGNNYILLSIGDFFSHYLAQENESLFGKIIKIDLTSKNYEIISMGHRNPQGLYFDEENNIILETEHGPVGGDEINLIEVEKIRGGGNKILNYGWPLVSAGTHGIETSVEFKKKYPFYKSHSKYGFAEPLKSFSPAIGISEIVGIGQNNYVASSLLDKSLYFFQLNQKKIVKLNRVEVFERVRDLKFKNNKLYLFLEDSVSIGIINLK